MAQADSICDLIAKVIEAQAVDMSMGKPANLSGATIADFNAYGRRSLLVPRRASVVLIRFGVFSIVGFACVESFQVAAS